MMKKNDILQILSDEAEGFYLVNEIERIEKPSALEFYREYVSQNKPVIIKNALNDKWKVALEKWNDDKYLIEMMKDTEITVAVTPDGFGDSVKRLDENTSIFVKPFEMKMTMKEFINRVDDKDHRSSSTTDKTNVYYIQYQNDSFNIEFQNLWKDIDHSVIDFAEEAFNSKVDAINFWMGTDKSVSSLHKDPYENMYCVVRGSKLFTLLPPIDYPFLYEKEFKCATYNKDMEVILDEPEQSIPWIPVDPVNSIKKNISLGYPDIKRAHPIHIQVNQGEILYLPSLYYHRVAQSSPTNKTIAINYWFDMKFGLNYAYFQFLKAYHHQQQKIKLK